MSESTKESLLVEVKDLLLKIANRFYDSKYHESIIESSRARLMCDLLYLLGKKKKIDSLRVLDVGCGKCNILLFLRYFFRDRTESLVGVNLFPLESKVFVNEKIIAELFGDELGKIKYIQLDVDKEPIPFPNEYFDVVLLFDVLEHLYDPSFALGEINRVIKPEGYLCLKTPNCANLKNRLNLLLGKSPYHELQGWLFNHRFSVPKTGERKFQGHIREYAVEELLWLLSHFGFEQLHMELYPTERYHRNVLLKIYNVFERLYPNFAYTIGIIATKIKR